jgi:hypothetical protein
MTMHRSILITSALTLTLACTDAPGADDEAGTTTSPSTTDADASTDDGSGTSDGTSSSSSSDDGESLFVIDLDVIADPCDMFGQDCPDGEKCVPYATDGGNVWDSFKCVPVQGDQATGEPCTYDGPVESTDDCDATAWCLDSDSDGEGLCHAFCGGTPDEPECLPDSGCAVSGGGTITICMPQCHPLEQDCPEGEGCYWFPFGAFLCGITLDDIPTGEPCGYADDCQPGNFCAYATVLPDCDGESCCTNFCDLWLGNSQCAAVPGTECVSFFERGVGFGYPYENLGVCVLPL